MLQIMNAIHCFNKRSAVAEMGDCMATMATIDMGQKLGGTVPLFGGGRGRWVPK